MNDEWAIGRVTAYLALLEEDYKAWNSQSASGRPREQINREIDAQYMTMLKIAAAVDFPTAGLASEAGRGWKHIQRRRSAQMLLGMLMEREEVERNLGPSGPKAAAADFHPWVWEEAASRWAAGFYRDAVQAAATRIFDVELPKKLGVQPTSSPADLFAAFAPDRTGRKLRFKDFEEGTPTWTSAHRGAMLIGQGCVGAIRNPRTHRLAVSEQQAVLEELATLSLLARWIDDAELIA